MDEEALIASLTWTKTRTRLEGIAILHHGGTLSPLGWQPNPGPTTHSQTQAKQEQVTKRAKEDGDRSHARKRSHFMRMVQKVQKKGFEVTCPAEF